MRNTIKVADELFGKFYISDCNCSKYCSINSSKVFKSNALLLELPVYDLSDTNSEYLDSLNLHTKDTTLYDVYDKMESLYSTLCASCNIEEFFIHRM